MFNSSNKSIERVAQFMGNAGVPYFRVDLQRRIIVLNTMADWYKAEEYLRCPFFLRRYFQRRAWHADW